MSSAIRETHTPLESSAEGPLTRQSAGRRRENLAGYLRWLRASDLLVVAVALVTAQFSRFGLASDPELVAPFSWTVSYGLVSVVLLGCWLIMLQIHGAYDPRLSGHGIQEYRKVGVASGWLFAGVAIVSMALKLDFARGYVVIAFPLGTMLLLTSRWIARKWLVRRRSAGKMCDQVLLVGDHEHVESLVAALHRTPSAGYSVLGVCVDDAPTDSVSGIPVVGAEAEAVARALGLGVDVVAVSSSGGLGVKGLRRLGWALEGTDIDLVVAPGIMDVAGPRVLTRPVDGLPLIHVEAPQFEGMQRVFKGAMDRVGAAVLIVLTAPIMLAVALAIRLEDGGPALFQQERIGRDGRIFRVHKFRSMVQDAERQLVGLLEMNEGAGPLFKLRTDPRVTRVGRVIRKHSLDELPQLFNVLKGTMSLVGPRPPLPSEVAEYESAMRRRLLVKPGMTGLWQVSGRSDLPWEEAVRLDLYYVENWTPVLDLMILWRTVGLVLMPRQGGAY